MIAVEGGLEDGRPLTATGIHLTYIRRSFIKLLKTRFRCFKLAWRQHLLFRFNDDWCRAIHSFAYKLSVVLGDVLVSVAASPREDLLFHDGNVLVVVKEDSLDVRWKVIEVEREVEKEFNWKIGISPIIVKDDEKEFFLEAFR